MRADGDCRPPAHGQGCRSQRGDGAKAHRQRDADQTDKAQSEPALSGHRTVAGEGWHSVADGAVQLGPEFIVQTAVEGVINIHA
jgi:hypothetical protein